MDEWGVGYPECNNGVVMFLSIFDRVMYIYVGSGALRKLSEDALEEIIREMKLLLKDENYDEAVLVGIHSIGLALSDKLYYPTIMEIITQDPYLLFVLIFFIFCCIC